MIERIIEYSVRNRFLVLAGTFALVLWGMISIARTPIDAIPDLSENQVIVFADWMGRSPQEVEDQVTYPLSVNLQGLAGVKAVRSTSEFNFSMINIIFEDGVGFYFARERVLERLSVASTFLPAGVVPYLAPDATALGQIFWYTVEGQDHDLSELRAVQDWYVRYQLGSVPGVAQVASVGGFVRSYEVAIDPDLLRAYGVTLGQVVDATQRSNSAVGGNVVVKNDAEFLIRGVGWIESLSDLQSVVVTTRDGVPVRLQDVAFVSWAPEPRRSVLEKDGQEVVGGVVLMRYGENPLEITERIKAKIAELAPGLPEGVRIVPFYDRTRLIQDAIGTVSGVLVEEMVIATVAILLILTHAGSALVVVATLPLAVLISFILMRLFGVPSNIMSLAGIAISIGVLVDASIVMVENATHELTARFGKEKVHGDTRESVLHACKLVGRPVFFSVLIMLLSFLPVFVLGGMEGKMFHPLAYTKSFAMIGVAILSITFVPALLPVLLRGRLRSEMENPIVRSFIEVYRPVLTFLLRHPKPFLLSFAVLLGIGVNLAGRLGREFMPPLDEGSILDMPVTIPSVSVSKVSDDLRVRDEVLRSFPEVELVVGKAGRADTPTDPAPPDMVETVISLRPQAWWPERSVRFDDVREEAGRVLSLLEERGVLSPVPEAERSRRISDASMFATEDLDRLLRSQAASAQHEARGELARALAGKVVTDWIAVLKRKDALRSPVSPERRAALVEALLPVHSGVLTGTTTRTDIDRMIRDLQARLVADGIAQDRSDLRARDASLLESVRASARTVLGQSRRSFEAELTQEVERARDRFWKKQRKETDRRLLQLAPTALLDALAHRLSEGTGVARALAQDDLTAIRQERQRALERGLFLWRKSKDELVQEMDTALRMPGWGNIWTQPIINRIDMLATGVRTMVGVKVFGDDIYEIQEVSENVAAVLREVTGAVDVFPDQIVGENYLEIDLDHAKAARYGINVGDVHEVIEVALGGRTVTTTVEGRRRFPVRVRYARDFRADEEAIGNILVAGLGTSASLAGVAAGSAGDAMGNGPAGGGMDVGPTGAGGMEAGGPGTGAGGSGGGGSSSGVSPVPSPTSFGPSSLASGGLPGPVQVPLREIATIRVVEGPSMIKSENGLLRSYVQLNVRGRDVVGFVEEAQLEVADRVELPAGCYLEWSGQFEHQVRAKNTLQIVFPIVIALILLLLYLTFHDWAHAGLMVLAVPGALAGGVIFQTIFDFNFSVAVWVGYIAAFGMATETGIVMMVYLRDAIARRGGLAGIGSEDEIRSAVIEGAVHRLRPKLLTEAVAIVGLMPMLWAHGTGAEIIRPMAAPVLGGLLVADEVIDLLLPVLFHGLTVRRWKRLQGAAG